MSNSITLSNVAYQTTFLNKVCNCKNSPLLMPDAKKEGKYRLFNANNEIGKCDFGEDKNYISIIKYGSGIGKVKLRPKYSNVIGTMGIINEQNCDLYYLFYLLHVLDFSKVIEVGTAPNMYFEDFGNLKVIIPEDLKNQEKLGMIMRTIDSLIDNKKKELEKTKQYKASMLYKMFPQEGKLVPEIRFKGFNGDWKENKFDISQISKGQGYSKNDLSKSGAQLFLYGRMYTNYQIYVTEINSYTDSIYNGTIYSNGNEVVIPASGETAEDISRATAVLTKGIILGGDLNIIKVKKAFNQIFLSLLITYTQFHYELGKKAQGKTIVHIHGDDISSIPFLYPELKEQEKIANFFVKLDSMISNQEKEIEVLEHMKATLLSKMFA